MINQYQKIKKQLRGKPHRFSQGSGDSLMVHFEKNNLKEVTSKQNNSFQLEVIDQQKNGTSSSNFFDSATLVKKAIASAQFGDKVNYKFPPKQPLPKVKLYSPKVAALKPQDFIKLGQKLIAAIQQADPDILVNVKISRTVANSSLSTSAGFTNKQLETQMSVYAEGELVKKGDILLIDEYW